MNILLKSGVSSILREVVQYLHAVVAKASLRCEIWLLGTIVVEPQVRGNLSARVLGALQLLDTFICIIDCSFPAYQLNLNLIYTN